MQPSSTSPAGSKSATGPTRASREPTDAIVRVVLACVCGSDLWYYRGDSPFEPGPIGHEFVGVVEDVGARRRQRQAKGDFVIAPFAFSDGTCPHCRHGITTACVNGGFFPANGDGGQGEAVRVPLADGTLVAVPGSGHSDEMLRSLLTLSDVMATGHHAAVCADVEPGDDRRGRRRRRRRPLRRAGRQAPRRRAHHRAQPPRRTARSSRASSAPPTSSSERGDEAIEAVMELTGGVGVDATLECVGTGQAMQTGTSNAGLQLVPRTRFSGHIRDTFASRRTVRTVRGRPEKRRIRL